MHLQMRRHQFLGHSFGLSVIRQWIQNMKRISPQRLKWLKWGTWFSKTFILLSTCDDGRVNPEEAHSSRKGHGMQAWFKGMSHKFWSFCSQLLMKLRNENQCKKLVINWLPKTQFYSNPNTKIILCHSLWQNKWQHSLMKMPAHWMLNISTS